jgi:hypothetical protein
VIHNFARDIYNPAEEIPYLAKDIFKPVEEINHYNIIKPNTYSVVRFIQHDDAYPILI